MISANDPDWFAFTLTAPGQDGDVAWLDFAHALGDIDLYLYDRAGTTLLGRSEGIGDQEAISRAGGGRVPAQSGGLRRCGESRLPAGHHG